MTCGLEVLDHVALAIRQHTRLELLDAEAARHRARGGCMVPRQHHDAQPLAREIGERIGGGLLDRVGDRKQARDLSAGRDEDHGGALRPEGRGPARELGR